MTRTSLKGLLLTSTLLASMGFAYAQDAELTIESWRNDDLEIWQTKLIPAFEAKHPGIKVKFTPSAPAEYNAVSNCVLVCPITSNTAPWPWKVMLPEPPTEDAVTGAILVDQLKSIDAKARNIQDTGQRIDRSQIDEVLARLATLTT